MNKFKGISIVVPVYNEEKALLHTLEHLINIMNSTGIDWELIMVNDGSTDKTSNILRESKLNFRLIEHENNKGYGASIKSGMKESRYDVIAITDADGTYPNEVIPELINEMNRFDYDMVIGARTSKDVKIPIIRKPAKWVLNKLANYLCECRIPDLNSGLRIFKKKEFFKFIKILPDGFSLTTTITIAMLTNDKKVKFVTINYFKREGKSKIKPIRDTLTFIQLIVRTVIYFNPLKVFLPLSLVLFLASLIVFVYSTFFLSRSMDATVVTLLMSSIHILAIGMIADLVDKRCS